MAGCHPASSTRRSAGRTSRNRRQCSRLHRQQPCELPQGEARRALGLLPRELRQVDLSILQEAFWENAEFDVTRKELQNSDLITKIDVERSYDAAQWGMGADPACLWFSLASWNSEDPSNIAGYASQAMDDALEGLRTAQTPDEIKAAMGTVQTVWNEEMPSPISGYLKWVVAVAPEVQGVTFNSGTTIQFDKAYIDQ